VAVRKVPMTWTSSSHDRLAYVIFVALLSLEFLFFCRFAEREIIWAYPNHHDQLGFLFGTYDLYADFLNSGFGAWRRYLTNPTPQGILFPVQGFFLCLLFGATRLTCLGVNFILFGALQACLMYALRCLTGNIWFGFVGVGLLLSQISAFFFAGGLFDYRIDFSAYCLYGIWTLMVLRSGVFSDTKWTIVAALVAAWLVLTRFVAVPYILGATSLTSLVIGMKYRRAHFEGTERKEVLGRITRAGLFLTIVAASTTPFIYLARNAIWKYYGGHHLIGHEKYIRAAEQGITGLLGHLTFYPDSIWSDHLGPRFIVLSLGLLCVAFAFRRAHRKDPASASSDPPRPIQAFLFVVATIVTPLIVLTLNPTKSHVVGGIVGVPVALVVLLAISRIGLGTNPGTQNTFLSPRACAILATVSMAFGTWNYLSHLTGHGPFFDRRVEITHLMKIYDTIGRYVETAGWKGKPFFSVNLKTDAMNGPAISVAEFERRGVIIRLERLLGNSIFAGDRDAVFQQLRQTDILVLGDTSKRFGLSEHYPIHHSLTPLSGDIERWARSELVSLVSTPSVEGRGYTVYVRPAARVTGLTWDDCIPAEGVWLTADSRVIRQRPLWIMEGTIDEARAPAAALTADLYQENTLPVSVPVDMKQDGSSFTITLDFRKVVLLDEGEVSVILRPVSETSPGNGGTLGELQTRPICRWGHIRMESASNESR
jgi:hypothetical protein